MSLEMETTKKVILSAKLKANLNSLAKQACSSFSFLRQMICVFADIFLVKKLLDHDVRRQFFQLQLED